ncbi:hypothetical protein [Spirillospora sp. NPDC047279]|uniref:hypothetical protein n=1 Tax=Spirillospora sp. NPDC047279 TaxID=3155478 RepID=UPI0033C2121D
MTSTHAIREDLAGRAIEQRPPRRTYLSGAPAPGAVLVPPIRLAPAGELIAAARRSPLYEIVQAQVGWARAGREVEPDGQLSVEGFEELLDLMDESVRRAAARSEEIAQSVRRFWDTLIQVGILHVDGVRSLVWPGPCAVALAGADDEGALAAWRALLIAMLDRWSGVGQGNPEVEGLSTNLLVFLYTRSERVVREDLAPLMDPRAQAGIRFRIDVLSHAGLVEQEGGDVWISPLGTFVCRELLQDATGLVIPTVGCQLDADAGTLLQALTVYRVDYISEEVSGWLAARSVEHGVAEICAALPEASPMARRAGLDLLAGTFDTAFGTQGRRALMSLAEDPRLGSLAHNYLTVAEREQVPVPGRAASTWALVDLAAMSLQAGTPPFEMVHTLGYVGQPGDQMARLIGLFGDVDHPWAERVLDAMIDHHPQPEVVEAARSARARLGTRAAVV